MKTILITGSTDGLGLATATKLLELGHQVIIHGRNEEKLASVHQSLLKISPQVSAYQADFSDLSSVLALANTLKSDYASIDVLINNAGIWQKKMQIDQISQDTIEAVIETNLSALIHTSRLLIPTLRTRDSAAIINVVSKSGVVAENLQSAYTASKYGARGFTEVLKVDLKDSNIKVAGVYQAGTKTKMFEKANENVSLEKFKPREVSAIKAVKEVEHVLANELKSANAKIIYGELPEVKVDFIQFKQLLKNLFENVKILKIEKMILIIKEKLLMRKL